MHQGRTFSTPMLRLRNVKTNRRFRNQSVSSDTEALMIPTECPLFRIAPLRRSLDLHAIVEHTKVLELEAEDYKTAETAFIEN
ncbi:hypothetical protein Tco_1272650 [Tanacetum coccineum]